MDGADPRMMDHIVRGILMVGATGIVQVLAQFALSHLMDVLPSPPESRFPRFFMLTHSVGAVMILLIGHVLQVTLWAMLYFFYWRDARLTKIFEGTSEIQQRIISDHLLGRGKSA